MDAKIEALRVAVIAILRLCNRYCKVFATAAHDLFQSAVCGSVEWIVDGKHIIIDGDKKLWTAPRMDASGKFPAGGFKDTSPDTGGGASYINAGLRHGPWQIKELYVCASHLLLEIASGDVISASGNLRTAVLLEFLKILGNPIKVVVFKKSDKGTKLTPWRTWETPEMVQSLVDSRVVLMKSALQAWADSIELQSAYPDPTDRKESVTGKRKVRNF